MTTSHSNALLEPPKSYNEDSPSSLRLTNDVKTYSKTPKTVLRQLRAEGLPYCACLVYWAIADRQRYAAGEYFRSNKDLADEVQMSVASVKNGIRLLIAKGYLKRWYINGGRRMRVICKGQAVSPEGLITKPPRANDSPPYKDNDIKITTTEVCAFLDSHRELLGGQLDRLVSKYGEIQVRDGLRAWDATDQSRVGNTIGWITDAIKHRYPTRPAKPAKFPESIIEQENIIATYAGLSPENAKRVEGMYAAYETQNGYKGGTAGIAHKIYKGKI